MPFPIPGMPQAPAAQAATLNVSTIEQTNTIVLNCPLALYKEIEYLCEEVDKAAASSTEVVQVLKISGGTDPTLLKDALLAMQGQPRSSQGGGQRGGFPGAFGGGNPFVGGGSPFSGGMRPGGMGGMGGGMMTPGGMGGGRGQGGGMGGGFPGMGGGTGGMGGGRGMGGGTGGMGGGRGAGGGGGTRGGGRQAMADPPPPGMEGQRPFAEADMDVPPARPAAVLSTIYDPDEGVEYQQIGYQAPAAQPPMPKPVPMPKIPALPTQPPATETNPDDPNKPFFSAPKPGSLTVEVLPELGIIIVRAKNQQDLKEATELIQFIERTTKTAQLKLEIVPMKHQDCGVIVNTLSTIYSRVNVGPGGISLATGTGAGGGGLGIFGGAGGFNRGGTTGQVIGQLYFLPLPRFNSIFVVAPESRLPEIKAQIDTFDKPNGAQLQPKRISLKRAPASVVSNQITSFFSQRYTQEQIATLQLRVTPDVSGNALFIQASPADLADIEALIAMLDSSESTAINQLKVIKIKNGDAGQISQVIGRSLALSALNPQQFSGGGTAGLLGGGGQFGGGTLNAGLGGGTGGQFGFGQQAGGFGGLGLQNQVIPASTFQTKSTSLQFVTPVNGKIVESGLLEDVHLVPDIRTNSIVVSANERTMKLIEAILEQLDGFSAAQGSVKVFKLNKADANNTSNLLLNLFARAQQQGAGGFGGFGGFGGLGQQQNQARPLINVTGEQPAPGATLIDLRIIPDTRTNSLIVSGSLNDLATVETLIVSLDNVESVQQKVEVIRLRNTAAADVQTALVNFFQTQNTNQNAADQVGTTTGVQQAGTSFLANQRNFGVVPEPISNALIVTGSQGQIDKIKKIVEQIDIEPAQVFIQVVVAEVTLRSNEEFGVEVGLQTPIVFARGVVTNNTPGTPGFNFNTTSALTNGLPNNVLFKQESVGFQGLGNLGVGRTNGGLVFSAANDTFNLLIRALKTQGRVEVLSKPQMTLLDNQFGRFQVGQQFPRPGNVTQNVNGNLQSIEYVDTGVVLIVTPRISPDGKVFMRILPQILSPNPNQIQIANGVQATPIDQTAVETSVVAMDGETVILGGLIRTNDVKAENKIPVLGDLPYVGAAFRYRTQTKERREIIFIMTPHILRTPADRMRILAEEAARMNWTLNDVKCMHGYGHEALSGASAFDAGQQGMWCYPAGMQYPAMTTPDGQSMVPAQPAPGTPTMTSPGVPMGGVPPTSNGLPTGSPPPNATAAPGTPRPLPPGSPMGMQTVPPPVTVPTMPGTPTGVAPVSYNPPPTAQPGVVPAGPVWYPTNRAGVTQGPVVNTPAPSTRKPTAKEGESWNVFPQLR
jgi:type II secretion system protein D